MAESTTSPDSGFQSGLGDTFHQKYEEFAADLLATFPELEAAINAAATLPKEERMGSYKTAVFQTTRTFSRETLETCPGTILPGVTLTKELWESTGRKTKLAIFEYISLLNLCVAFQGGGADTEEFIKEWAERVMRDARASMGKLDFENISQTFFKAFGTKGENLPPLPEKFLKGKLARLAEDMVKEFNPADFGLTPEDIEACERDPSRAFEILMKGTMGNPQMIQKAMGRVQKKLQDKVARGELKPQELVAEAEELIKEFQTHPAFVELMQSFRSAFSVDEDMETAQAAGRDNEGRLAIARARLRKKLEAKKAAGKK